MHLTEVELKDGKKFSGFIWLWRPKEGYFTLGGSDGPGLIKLSAVKRAIESSVRVRRDLPLEDVDLLMRAKEDGWDGF